MKHLFYALLFCALSTAAQADLFVKKSKTTPPPEEAPQESAQPESMAKTEQEPSIEDFAKKYQENCLQKKDDVLKGKPQKMLCACSAANLVESMSVEQIRLMATDTPEGLEQRNRMLLEVYAPCMEYPTQALLRHRCMNDKNIQAAVPNQEEICNCLSDKTAVFVQKEGPATLAKALKDNPENNNPLSSLMNSKEFQHHSQSTLLACMQEFALNQDAP